MRRVVGLAARTAAVNGAGLPVQARYGPRTVKQAKEFGDHSPD
jgi:hypothetical protein